MTIVKDLSDIIFSKSYFADALPIEQFPLVAQLAITVAEFEIDDIFDLEDQRHEDIMNAMTILLRDMNFSSKTFTFWIAFSMACREVQHDRGVKWLVNAMGIALENSKWRQDVDIEEWTGYRNDVEELFESFSETLGDDDIRGVVHDSWDEVIRAIGPQMQPERVVVILLEPCMMIILDFRKNGVFRNLRKSRVHSRGRRKTNSI